MQQKKLLACGGAPLFFKAEREAAPTAPVVPFQLPPFSQHHLREGASLPEARGLLVKCRKAELAE